LVDAIRIWIGTEQKTNLPCKVLQFSILKNTKQEIQFHIDPGFSWKNRNSAKLGIGTGFSLQRWTIPEKFQYNGLCLYLDADQLLFSDIALLWNYHNLLDVNPQLSIACTYQKDKWFKHAPATSVMLIDCEKAKNWPLNNQEKIEAYLQTDKDRKKYSLLMHAQIPPFEHLPLEIDINWNRFNKFVNGTKLLHYTEEPRQPWYDPKHPNKNLWRDAFREALKEGYITKEEVLVELNHYQKPTGCCRGQGLHPYWRKFIA